jgi:hypothetical protein
MLSDQEKRLLALYKLLSKIEKRIALEKLRWMVHKKNTTQR